ncbi:murein DD-endopeptidase MepM/ murein hydrolase activator NlpD [Duganella sp. 1224]|uniref:LysM peptidoglycan-binding domain-containing protein n=1 Tax=Duganella sp. 1224 TaxID=2587052 RepID=UPI0015CE338F|nr:LysM peptidoglycan-binding domain-containing protein [Duganella sp. 1224]NYE59772.1 murein DD-endopeptidase MepM/ murein hydrolase activator NlpD [Duganella sp. 1224]
MPTHKVRDGESISSIAKLFHVDKASLIEANHIKDPDRIHTGQVLTIPKKREQQAPPAVTPPAKPSPAPAAREKSLSEQVDEAMLHARELSLQWIENLLQKLRTDEANERVQKEEKADVPKDTKPPEHKQTPPAKKGSRSTRQLSDVKENLKERLGKEAHVVQFGGVKLTDNEKKQIVAAVAVCEMNADGFGSINTDQEFVGRKYGKKGIGGLTYSRIVHIGLSYGVIQYTQDSGSLGDLLVKMKAKNGAKFTEVFGGGDSAIADSLITLTTTGRADLANNATIPMSGQAYWNSIRRKPEGKELARLANGPTQSDLPVSREIRGKRVQPIPAQKGATATDLWTGTWKERFLAAGKVLDFQEVQLDFAVERYFNPLLQLAKTNNVRSALGLAFLAACNIRGGVGQKLSRLLYSVADELKVQRPFKSSEDERKCLDAIAAAKGKIGDTEVHEDESRRVKLLIKDELGFLAEDLYDTSTY